MNAPTTDPLGMLHDVADAVAVALRAVTDWGPSGVRHGQYAADLLADAAALRVLRAAGVGVLSEESGIEHPERPWMVVVDPLDGSTNASQGIPWYATSLCLVDADGPMVALVVNQARGVRFWAERGGGAFCDGRSIQPSTCGELDDAIVVISALPPAEPGWRQFRAMGACALDLCAVADGVFDGFVDFGTNQHGVWDYLGGLLICREAGVPVVDVFDRELVVRDDSVRRTPVAAATPELQRELLALRERGLPMVD
jgi:fructose-1,6-bisphosphatase/inositol monophosphatase family enzyme